MNVNLSQDVESKLNHLADESGRAADELVRDLVENYVAHDDWFRSQVRVGMADIEAGRLLDHEEVSGRIKTLLREKQSH